MQLTIDIPDDWDERVLEAFGAPDITQPIHMGNFIPSTEDNVTERLKNFIRSTVYAYEDNKAVVQTMRKRGEEIW